MACKYIYENKEYTKEEFYKFVGDNLVEKKSVPKYNKILFPTGNTASRIEGHSTLEEFKKEKEGRLNKLLKDKQELEDIKSGKIKDEIGFGQSELNYELEQVDNEINQLKQELERVETEGFAALKPIYNFYENTVQNVLNKQFGKESIKRITDEYGNDWFELTLTENMANTVLLSKQGIIDNNNTQLPEHIYQSYKHELIGQAVSLSTKNIVSKQLTQILSKLLEWIKNILSNIGFTNIKTINTFKDLENVFKSIDTRIDLSPNDNNFNMNKHLLQQDTITNEKNTIPDCL